MDSLNHLHQSFTIALKTKCYLGIKKKDPKKLVYTKKKSIRLNDVFRHALKQIQSEKLSSQEKNSLLELQQDGKELYQRYEKNTQTLFRAVVKWLARVTPINLKPYLPNFFSNRMKEAEDDTLKAYLDYKNFIEKKLKGFDPTENNDSKTSQAKASPQSSQEGKVDSTDSNNKTLTSIDATTTSSKDSNKDPSTQNKNSQSASSNADASSIISGVSTSSTKGPHPKKNQVSIPPKNTPAHPKVDPNLLSSILHNIENLTKALQNYKASPFSLKQFIAKLTQMTEAAIEYSQLKSDGLDLLNNLGIHDKELALFKNPEWKKALTKFNIVEIEKLLNSHPWHADFIQALNQKQIIQIRAQSNLAKVLLITDENNNKRLHEKDIKDYKGEFHIPLSNSLNVLTMLKTFLDENPSCHPHTLKIDLIDHSMTPELLTYLLDFQSRVGEIQIHGLKELDLQQLSSSKQIVDRLVQNFDKFSFPDLAHIVLPNNIKEWTPKEFFALLAICPTVQLLQDCLNLSSFPITDDLLNTWVKNPNFRQIKKLDLSHCQNLTTDSLFSLALCSQLVTLSLPNLSLGKKNLKTLPKFDNPFQIKLLYTSSKLTQPLAAGLYTGSMLFSSLFQIPLVRLGEENVFLPNQTYLDSKSVSYWLYQDDYKHLKSTLKDNIRVVVADKNIYLTDQNLIPFFQKFSFIETLSLAQCPNISTQAIINLLKACPNIKSLDLTGCQQIQDDLLDEKNLEILKKLSKVTLTGTGITKQSLAKKEVKGLKYEYHVASLTVKNEDLTDENALEKILNEMDLRFVTRMDFTGCTNLTDDMLSKLLDRLNVDSYFWIDGKKEKNPQRSNLTTLILTGCSAITDKAFHEKFERSEDKSNDSDLNAKINTKILGTLEHVITEGTQINLISETLPSVVFSELEEKGFLIVNPVLQLKRCEFMKSLSVEKKREFKHLVKQQIHDRIVVELFSKDPNSKIDLQPVNLDSDEFYDLDLLFRTTDDVNSPTFSEIPIKTFKDVLLQSPYFLKRFREGSKYRKASFIATLSQHATPEAVLKVMDLFNGKLFIKHLDLDTAAHVAELVGPKLFNLPYMYQDLLKHIRDYYPDFEFDSTLTDKLFLISFKLDDLEGKKQYQEKLIRQLNLKTNLREIHILALTHGLSIVLNHIQNQFKLENADEMLLMATTLSDQASIKVYEQKLIGLLRNGADRFKINQLAANYGLRELNRKLR